MGRSENTQRQGGYSSGSQPPRALFTHHWTLLSFITISSFAHKTETVNACVCSYKNAVQLYIFHNNAGLFLYILKYLVVGFLIYVFKLSGCSGKASLVFFRHRLLGFYDFFVCCLVFPGVCGSSDFSECLELRDLSLSLSSRSLLPPALSLTCCCAPPHNGDGCHLCSPMTVITLILAGL